jgi:DNA-binding response OmpR family regulator
MALVLLIDDDDLVRGMLTKALTNAGHKVTEAADGQQGIEVARSASFDIVVTDLVMPVQEGVETIMTLRRERPRLPIIAISGGVSRSKLYLDIAGKIGARRILPKPFTPKELLALIEQVLAEESQRNAPGTSENENP